MRVGHLCFSITSALMRPSVAVFGTLQCPLPSRRQESTLVRVSALETAA